MSDIEKSFAFLHDSVPQWLTDIARVEEKAAAMHSNLVQVKVKTASIDSIHHDDLGAAVAAAVPSHEAPTDPVGNRKRKTLSALSGHASGPSRYRPRTMVMVNYDGDMQKSFELLVRAIGTGRNYLRKAKMEAKMGELAALAGPSDDDDDDDDDDDEDEDEDAILAKINYRPRMASMRARTGAQRSLRPGIRATPAISMELFDTTDKILEQAQEQCERAAHVLLREGDCLKELKNMRQNFELVLETAKTQVGKSNSSKALDPPKLQSHNTSDTSVSSTAPSYKRHFPHLSPPLPDSQSCSHTKGALFAAPITSLPQPRVVDIEVDEDEEDEEEDFVMPPLRLTSRLGA